MADSGDSISEIEYICVNDKKTEPREFDDNEYTHMANSGRISMSSNFTFDECELPLVAPAASAHQVRTLVSPSTLTSNQPRSSSQSFWSSLTVASSAVPIQSSTDNPGNTGAKESASRKRSSNDESTLRNKNNGTTKSIKISTDEELTDPRIAFYESKFKNQLKKLLVILYTFNQQQSTYNPTRDKQPTFSTKNLDEEKNIMKKKIEFALRNDMVKFERATMSSVIGVLTMLKLAFEDLLELKKKAAADTDQIKKVCWYLSELKSVFNRNYINKYFTGSKLPVVVNDILKPIQIQVLPDPSKSNTIRKQNDPRLRSFSVTDPKVNDQRVETTAARSSDLYMRKSAMFNTQPELEPEVHKLDDSMCAIQHLKKQTDEKKCSETLLSSLNEMLRSSTGKCGSFLKLKYTKDSNDSSQTIGFSKCNEANRQIQKRKKSPSSNNSTKDSTKDESHYKKRKHTSCSRARSRTPKRDLSRSHSKSHSYSMSLRSKDLFENRNKQ
jgi:hypothetical protein